MRQDADIIIIGGGCAGLSLAARLALQGNATPRTLILEPRLAYTHDRTWSGWRARGHMFQSCVSATWSRWAVAYQGRQIVRGAVSLPYDTIPADRFYATATTAIAGAAPIQLRQGVTATRLGQTPQSAWVETDHGRLTASLLVDTRPPSPDGAPFMQQSFTGLEIETATPCFDPSTVGLMAFEPEHQQAVTFLYTLPFTPTRALLEWTHMSPAALPPPDTASLAIRLRARLGCDFHVIRAETGVLPMRPYQSDPTNPGRILLLGTPAGALRASTGYGFNTIQCQADALADTLRQGAGAAIGWRAAPPPAWTQAMDRLFLRVLNRHPEAGPNLFTTLFRRCPSLPLVRFLSGTGGLLDGGRVALAMPKAPFLRALAGAA